MPFQAVPPNVVTMKSRVACHVPPALHGARTQPACASEIGIEAFEADRSATHLYCTASLAGLWTYQKGGFFHGGRFATLLDVVNHYDAQFNLSLSNQERRTW
jgi:hypothetical protein